MLTAIGKSDLNKDMLSSVLENLWVAKSLGRSDSEAPFVSLHQLSRQASSWSDEGCQKLCGLHLSTSVPHRRMSQSLFLKNKEALFPDACSKILMVCQTVIGPSVPMHSLVREMGLRCADCTEKHLSLPAASPSWAIVYTANRCVHRRPLSPMGSWKRCGA